MSEQDKVVCSKMDIDSRRRMHTHLLQTMLNMGLNGFAIEMVCESLLKSIEPQKLDFILPIAREDCKQWAGVRIILEPIKAE